MKIAYIVHPIGGNVNNNIQRILEIIQRINVMEPDVVPFAPYIGDVMALNDDDPEMRIRGIKNNMEIIRRGLIDEMRIYGNRISDGMKAEIIAAWNNDIRVELMDDNSGILFDFYRIETEYESFSKAKIENGK